MNSDPVTESDLADIFDAPTRPTKPVEIIDRSDAERYMLCPEQGRAVDARECITDSTAAAAGQAVHDAIAAVTKMVKAGMIAKVIDASEAIIQAATNARPDIQTAAIEHVKYSAYAIARRLLFLENGEPRSGGELLRFDGGEGPDSGQLSADIEMDGWIARCTGELDLLMATASPQMLEIMDYKSGQGKWTADDVATSFQLGTWYPWLVFRNYPGCERVRVRVWNTAKADITPAVEIDRAKFMASAEVRIAKSAQARHDWRGKRMAPTFPSAEKCVLCDHAANCPEAKGPTKDVNVDAIAVYEKYIVLTTAADKLADAMTARADKLGDFEVAPGVYWGRGASRSTKPAAKAYKA